MKLKSGEELPDAKVFIFDKDPKETSIKHIIGDDKVIIFGIPGAFTPTCSTKHLPGFITSDNQLNTKNIKKVICISVNDPFVMDAWGQAQEVKGRIRMVADGDGSFTRAMGLALDLGVFGLGKRSKRYAMIVDDGVIRHFNVEAGPVVGSSSAANMLALL